MDFYNILKQKSEECNAYLEKYFSDLNSNYTTLYDAMNYSISSGGKRLRMILLIEACRLFSDDYEDSIPFACAIEMIHTYSLIHDDLPSIDNSSIRRGKPCNHIVYGENMAILAGDGLLHYSFEIMSHYTLTKINTSNKYLKAMYEIAKSCGINGMLYGQSIDVQNENKLIDVDLLTLIYKKKTAELLKGALKAGAIIGGANDKEIQTIEDFAYSFGLAFQITDDILDVIGDQRKLGKNIGVDKNNNKVTYSSLLGIDKAADTAKEYMKVSIDCIKPLDRNDFFVNLCNYILNRDY